MTSISSRRPVFLDAAVLAAPTARSLILFGQLHAEASFVAKWSLAVEQEADAALVARAQRRTETLGRTVPPVLVSALRSVSDWGGDVIVPPAPDLAASLTDTRAGDRHVLAAASACGAGFVITQDVDDFGPADLARLGMSAANPDLFLAHWMTAGMYQFALERIAARRTLEPRTPDAIHASLGKVHPRLAAVMGTVYPQITILPATHKPPAESFRGTRCLTCWQPTSQPLANGICSACHREGDQ